MRKIGKRDPTSYAEKCRIFFCPWQTRDFRHPLGRRSATTRTLRPFSHSLRLFLSLDLYSRSSRGRDRKRKEQREKEKERERETGGRKRELNKSNKKLINKEEEFSLALSKRPIALDVSTLSHPSQFLRMSPRTPVAVALRAATTKRNVETGIVDRGSASEKRRKERGTGNSAF